MVAVGMTRETILSVFEAPSREDPKCASYGFRPPTDSINPNHIQKSESESLVGFGFEIFHSDFNPCNPGCNPTICGFNELFIVHGALY